MSKTEIKIALMVATAAFISIPVSAHPPSSTKSPRKRIQARKRVPVRARPQSIVKSRKLDAAGCRVGQGKVLGRAHKGTRKVMGRAHVGERKVPGRARVGERKVQGRARNIACPTRSLPRVQPRIAPKPDGLLQKK